MEQPYYWDKFRLEIFIRCDIEQAFKAWATPSGIRTWFRNDVRVQRDGSPISQDAMLRPGDEMMWADFVGQELAPSNILEVRENSLIKQTFDSKKILLTNKFQRVEKDVLVELTQENMPTDPNGMAAWHLSCFTGWTFRLANLKSVLEHKIDIRESDPNLIFKPAKYIYDESWK